MENSGLAELLDPSASKHGEEDEDIGVFDVDGEDSTEDSAIHTSEVEQEEVSFLALRAAFTPCLFVIPWYCLQVRSGLVVCRCLGPQCWVSARESQHGTLQCNICCHDGAT